MAHLSPLRFGLRNFWQPVLLADQLDERPFSFMRLGEPLVAWRDADGVPHIFRDFCPHRGVPLSFGDVVDGRLQCRYHGLQFDGTGQCRLVPHEQQLDGRSAQRVQAQGYPCQEFEGFIYAYIGEVDIFPPPALQLDDQLTSPDYVRVFRTTVWKTNWQTVRDNTPDPAHLPFLHAQYAAKVDANGTFFVESLGQTLNPVFTPEYVVTLLEHRLQITAEGNTISSKRDGVDYPEATWVAPSLAKVNVPLGPDQFAHLYQYEVPIDDQSTALLICVAMKVPHPDARTAMQRALADEIFPFVFEKTFEEDAWLLEYLGDVDAARAREQLLPTDNAMIRVRKRIHEIYDEQSKVYESAP
jgi:phenylpropionate dioxygenase-like ring-hydroxylating dioxygenase large terminal subunit